jgi:DNA-binding transcriptional MerR regulator
MVDTGKPLRSGQLAKLAGVSSDTLRYYERLGILPASPRTAAGYRLYTADSLERLTLVRHAVQLGFTLKELARIVRARDKGEAPCLQVLALAEDKLSAVAERIRELREAEKFLQNVTREWREQLAHAEPGKKALLLQSLTIKPELKTKLHDKLKRRRDA